MPLDLHWPEIALRIALTVLGAICIGLNRTEHGQPAGVRTMLLVSLAAAASMIQANLLLPMSGKHPDSFAVMDLMRLPLGILSGMGFIGAGAILRKGETVKGITTAATLWFSTVMGLCFGGGQLGLGIACVSMGVAILTVMKWAENRLPIDHRATVRIVARGAALTEVGFERQFAAAGFRIKEFGLQYAEAGESLQLKCEVRWKGPPDELAAPHVLLRKLAAEPGIVAIDWEH